MFFVAILCAADGSGISDTIKVDFLNLDSPQPTAQRDEEVIEDWIDTIRRKRTRRQSRFCLDGIGLDSSVQLRGAKSTNVVRVKDTSQLRGLLQSGYSVIICSNAGFNNGSNYAY